MADSTTSKNVGGLQPPSRAKGVYPSVKVTQTVPMPKIPRPQAKPLDHTK